MKTTAIKALPPVYERYRTLEGWALGILIENHAVTECSDHKADPEAWRHASDEAKRNPFPGKSSEECLGALEAVMQSIGDTCPDCR